MNKVRGFTLIELIVTLVLVAIVAVIAAPSMMSMIRSQRLVTATNELVSILNYARSEAIKRSNTIFIAPSANGWGGGATVSSDAAGTNVLRTMNAVPSGFSLVTSDGNTTTIQYQASGFTNIADTFYLCSTTSGQEGRQIQVFITGRVSTTPITANTSGPCG